MTFITNLLRRKHEGANTPTPPIQNSKVSTEKTRNYLWQKITGCFTACYSVPSTSDPFLQPQVKLDRPQQYVRTVTETATANGITAVRDGILKPQNTSPIQQIETKSITAASTPKEYEVIEQGLFNLHKIWENWQEAYSKVPHTHFFKKENIPTLDQLDSLLNQYLIHKNMSNQTSYFVQEEGNSNAICVINNTPYLVLLKLTLGHVGTKDNVVMGINLKTGESEAVLLTKAKPSSEDGWKILNPEIYKRLRNLIPKEKQNDTSISGGILPLKGMLNLTSTDPNEKDLMTQIIISKFCNFATLNDLVFSDINLTPQQVYNIADKLFTGLLSLHAAGLLHLDLKTENIFLDKIGEEITPYLGDFDRTAFNHSKDKRVGTLNFLPPEVILNGMSEYNEKSEVWGFGLILYYLFSRQVPYIIWKIDQNSKDKNFEGYSVRAEFSRMLPWNQIKKIDETKVSNLLKNMVCPHPKDRWSLQGAYEEFKKIKPEELTFNPPNVPHQQIVF